MKGSRISVILLLLASLCGHVVAHAQTSPGSLAPNTDKPVYLSGEPVKLILTNIGLDPITWSNPTAIKTDCFIYDAYLHLVFDGRKTPIPFYWDPVTIYPYQSATTYWNQNYLLDGNYG